MLQVEVRYVAGNALFCAKEERHTLFVNSRAPSILRSPAGHEAIVPRNIIIGSIVLRGKRERERESGFEDPTLKNDFRSENMSQKDPFFVDFCRKRNNLILKKKCIHDENMMFSRNHFTYEYHYRHTGHAGHVQRGHREGGEVPRSPGFWQ